MAQLSFTYVCVKAVAACEMSKVPGGGGGGGGGGGEGGGGGGKWRGGGKGRPPVKRGALAPHPPLCCDGKFSFLCVGEWGCWCGEGGGGGGGGGGAVAAE